MNSQWLQIIPVDELYGYFNTFVNYSTDVYAIWLGRSPRDVICPDMLSDSEGCFQYSGLYVRE